MMAGPAAGPWTLLANLKRGDGYAMPTATNKQRLLNQLFTVLSKRYGAAGE